MRDGDPAAELAPVLLLRFRNGLENGLRLLIEPIFVTLGRLAAGATEVVSCTGGSTELDETGAAEKVEGGAVRLTSALMRPLEIGHAPRGVASRQARSTRHPKDI